MKAFTDEDLRRGQERGRLRAAGVETQRELIYRLMADRRMSTSQICAETGMSRQVAIGQLNRLRADKRIRFAGKVPIGVRGRRENVYERGAEDENNPGPIARRMRVRRTRGSGVIAGRITVGRGSKWGAGLA